MFGPPVSLLREAPQEAKAGVGFKSDHQREDNLFYFHTDHLGSTSYLTDTAGNVSQFVCYTPYGEAIVDEHLTTYENPFKFSGKELDDITGLYDHGARNRNPITAVWYGIDELFEKYPEISAYAYCHNNPITRIDPTGKADYYDEDGTLICSEFNDDNNKYLVSEFDTEEAIRNGRYIPIPNKSVIERMDETYEKTDQNQLEYGFRVGTQGTVTSIIEGTGTTKALDTNGSPIFTPGEISRELWASLRNAINENNGEDVLYSIHSHPNYNDGKYAVFGLAFPSNNDLAYKRRSEVYTDVVLSYGNIDFKNMEKYKLVAFYSSEGLVCTLNHSLLKTLSKKVFGY